MNNAIKKYVEESLKQLAEQPPDHQVVEESLEAHLLRFCKYLKGLQCGCKLGEEDSKFIWGNLVRSLAEGLSSQFFSSGSYLWAHDHQLSPDEWALYDLLSEAGKLKKEEKLVCKGKGKKGRGKIKWAFRQSLPAKMEASSSSSAGAVGGVAAQGTRSLSSHDFLPSLEKVTYLRKMVDVLKITTRKINELMVMEKRDEENIKKEFAALMARTDTSMNTYLELKSFVARMAKLQMSVKGSEVKRTMTLQELRDLVMMTDSPLSPTPPTSPVVPDPDMNDYEIEVVDEKSQSSEEWEGSDKSDNKEEELEGLCEDSDWEKTDEMLTRMEKAILERSISKSDNLDWSFIKEFASTFLRKPKRDKVTELARELDDDNEEEGKEMGENEEGEEEEEEEEEREKAGHEEEEEEEDHEDDIVKEKTLPQSSISIKKYGTPVADSSNGSKLTVACPHVGCPPPPAHYRDWKKNDFKCVCGAKFRNMAYLEKHITQAKASSTFKCDKCPYKVNRKCCFTKHQEEKHAENKPKQTKVACQLYECTRGCGKLFSTKGKMFEHQVKTGRECKFVNAQNPPIPKCPSGLIALTLMNMTAKIVVTQIDEMSDEDLTNPGKVSQEDPEAVKVAIAIKKQKQPGSLEKDDVASSEQLETGLESK